MKADFDKWLEKATVEHNIDNEYLVLIDDYEESISVKVDEPIDKFKSAWITDTSLSKEQAAKVFDKVELWINRKTSEDFKYDEP